MPCVFCRKPNEIYNVFTTYSKTSCTIKENLINVFGVEAKPYLYPTFSLCFFCINLIDGMIKLKERLWSLLCNKEVCRPIKMEKIWFKIAAVAYEDDDIEEDQNVLVRSPTPSKLLLFRYAREYNHTLENKIADIERNRSLSRASSARSTTSKKSETTDTVPRKRQRKRQKSHNWNPKRRRTKSRATSELSHRSLPCGSQLTRDRSDWDRSFSPLSDCSYNSSYRLIKSPVRQKGVQFNEQESKEQEEDARDFDSNKFYCGEKECSLYFEDVDVLNHHKMMDHNALALYFCDECQQTYTTKELLKLHRRIHDTFPFICPQCARDVRNQEALQEHLQEHLQEYMLISMRIDSDEEVSENVCENVTTDTNHNSNVEKPELNVIYLPYTDMVRETGDLDVTSDNLRLMNVDFLEIIPNSSNESDPVSDLSSVLPIDTMESESELER